MNPLIPMLVAGIAKPCRTRRLAGTLTIMLLAVIVWSMAASRRRSWQTDEVPVAFWAWRIEAPKEVDLNDVVQQTGARTLFLRAGQLDVEGGALRRIRPVTGSIPRGIALHLVYNATRALLEKFESLDVDRISSAVLAAFHQDAERARIDNGQIVGLQLDFDVPTRLLSRYGRTLGAIRLELPHEFQLSITGLPTWMNSTTLSGVLSACDFWVPQCYGAAIPQRIDQQLPITSPQYVAESVSHARRLRRPFYAGLADYGYAIHYAKGGSLIGLRGDLDPLLVARHPDFELTDELPSAESESEPGVVFEWRLTFRARRDAILDGAACSAGEWIVLSIPTGAGLRACARTVRELAGEKLLGLCVFRIPSTDDSTTLTLPEIAAALKDIAPSPSMDADVEETHVANMAAKTNVAVVTLTNNGSVAARMGRGALSICLRVPEGRLHAVSVDHFQAVEPVFEEQSNSRPCSLRRANAIKLTTNWWPPGAKAVARVELEGEAPRGFALRFRSILDDGTTFENAKVVKVNGTNDQKAAPAK